jgi:hypothetical protein
MRLDVAPYCRIFEPLEVYHAKTTRSDEPAPEVRWIVGDDVRIIGFDEFKCQIRLTVVRLDGDVCNIATGQPTEFFTEVPAVGNLETAVDDTTIVIDIDASQRYLMVRGNNIQYRITKIPGSEPLELRQHYLPIDQPVAEGEISSDKLYKCINCSPGEELQLKIVDNSIEFISKSVDEKLRYRFTEAGSIYTDTTEYERAFDLELLSKTIKHIPKNKQIRFCLTDELIELSYQIGDIGRMNYYQRVKNSSDIYSLNI